MTLWGEMTGWGRAMFEDQADRLAAMTVGVHLADVRCKRCGRSVGGVVEVPDVGLVAQLFAYDAERGARFKADLATYKAGGRIDGIWPKTKSGALIRLSVELDALVILDGTAPATLKVWCKNDGHRPVEQVDLVAAARTRTGDGTPATLLVR